MMVQCPKCKGDGRTWQHVLARSSKFAKLGPTEEKRQCPICHGIGRIRTALAEGQRENVVASDIGSTKPSAWREMSAVGEIQGIPTFRGKAIATDGVLIAIRQDSGKVVLGHLDSFVKEEVEKVPKAGKRQGKLAKLMKEFL